MEQHENEHAIAMMCRVLEVSRAGQHAYRTRPTSERKLEDRLISQLIRATRRAMRQCYGSPPMTSKLRAMGQKGGRHRVARLMRENDLGARRKHRFRKTTDLNHSVCCPEHLVARELTISAPDRVWVSGVTCIPINIRWLYLAVILDLYSRKIVGWATGTETDTDLGLRALGMAVKSRRPGSGLIFHSDRGSTYAATAFTDELKRLGIRASRSLKGDCWDNAVAKSFFSSLKIVWMPEDGYEKVSEGMHALLRYVEMFYSRECPPSYLGYVSPVVFEAVQLV